MFLLLVETNENKKANQPKNKRDEIMNQNDVPKAKKIKIEFQFDAVEGSAFVVPSAVRACSNLKAKRSRTSSGKGGRL